MRSSLSWREHAAELDHAALFEGLERLGVLQRLNSWATHGHNAALAASTFRSVARCRGRWAHALGYEQVDDDPHVQCSLPPWTTQRTGEQRSNCAIGSGHSWAFVPAGACWTWAVGWAVLALSLAEDLGTGGEIVGVDASAAMIAGALEGQMVPSVASAAWQMPSLSNQRAVSTWSAQTMSASG